MPNMPLEISGGITPERMKRQPKRLNWTESYWGLICNELLLSCCFQDSLFVFVSEVLLIFHLFSFPLDLIIAQCSIYWFFCQLKSAVESLLQIFSLSCYTFQLQNFYLTFSFLNNYCLFDEILFSSFLLVL